MTLERPFRLSVLSLVGSGLLALTLALGSALWVLVGLGGFVGCLFQSGVWPRWQVSRGVATVAAVVALQVAVVEAVAVRGAMVPAAHFLILVQIIWLSQERSTRHYGWLCLMSLVQMTLAGVLSVDLAFGICLLVYLPAGVLSLLLFNLRCELERNKLLTPSRLRELRLGSRLLASAGLVALAELVLTIVVFVYFPRFGLQILQLRPVQKGPRLSGFSDEVRFGDISRILDNPQEVMSVRLLRDGQPIQAEDFPLLWRGIALDHYEDGTWTTQDYISQAHERGLPYAERTAGHVPPRVVTQEVTLEPVNTEVLFHLLRLIELRGESPNLERVRIHRQSGTYSTADGSAVSLRYVARSRLPDWTHAQLRQSPSHARWATDYEPGGPFVQLPAAIQPPPDPRVREAADKLIQLAEGVPALWAANSLFRTRSVVQAEPLPPDLVHRCARELADEIAVQCPPRQINPAVARYADPLLATLPAGRCHERVRARATALVAQFPPGPTRRSAQQLVDQILALLPPERDTNRIRMLAESIVAGFEPEEVYSRVVTIEAYLKSRYDYSLSFGRAEPGLDPVEDFLFHKRAGHCEHFAAAMVVLLRSLRIPARLATGFHGGEWNEYGRYYIVRQRHAHAWVEVRLPRTRARWVSFNPTPAASAAPVAGQGWLARLSRRLAHLRMTWNSYVVNYSSQDQKDLARSVTHFLSRLPSALPLWGQGRLALGSGASAGATVFVVLTWLVVLGGSVALVLWALRRRARRRGARRDRAGRPTVAFYRKMDDLLRRRGFRRAPSLTPLEFARRVVAGGGSPYAPVHTLTEAFCRVLYGGHSLTPTERTDVHRALAALEATPRQRTAGPVPRRPAGAREQPAP